jgi:hypothetical protein
VGPGVKPSQPASEAQAGPGLGLVVNLLVWLGSLFVLGSSIIHFHLWDSFAYRALPTIGPLFLMQAIVGAVLAVVTSILRKFLLVLAETGFAFATAGGLIISVNFGLFGWKDTMSAPYAGLALAVEFTAGALLLVASALMARAWLADRKTRAAQGHVGMAAAGGADGPGPGGPPGASPPLGPRPAPQA